MDYWGDPSPALISDTKDVSNTQEAIKLIQDTILRDNGAKLIRWAWGDLPIPAYGNIPAWRRWRTKSDAIKKLQSLSGKRKERAIKMQFRRDEAEEDLVLKSHTITLADADRLFGRAVDEPLVSVTRAAKRVGQVFYRD